MEDANGIFLYALFEELPKKCIEISNIVASVPWGWIWRDKCKLVFSGPLLSPKQSIAKCYKSESAHDAHVCAQDAHVHGVQQWHISQARRASTDHR